MTRGVLCGEDRDLDMVIQDLVVYSERESQGVPKKRNQICIFRRFLWIEDKFVQPVKVRCGLGKGSPGKVEGGWT